MTIDSGALKEQMIRELLTLVQGSALGKELEIGQLVLFLEREWGFIYNGIGLDFSLLWEFCRQSTSWSQEDFMGLFGSLEPQYAQMGLEIRWPEGAASTNVAMSPEKMLEVQSALMKVLLNSPLKDIVRADELDLLLGEFVQASVVPVQLGELWNIFEEEGIPASLLRETFALFVGISFPVKLVLPGDLQSTTGASGGGAQHKKEVAAVILDCIRESPVHRIIDPERLAEHLDEELDLMWEDGAYNTQELWEILSEVEQITDDMLIHAFLLLEVRQASLPVKLWIPARVSNLSAEAKQAILSSENPAPVAEKKEAKVTYAANPYAINTTRSSTGGNKSAIRPSPRSALKGKEKGGRKKKKGGPLDDEKVSPVYIVVAVAVMVLSLIVYMLFVYEPKPKFGGEPISSVSMLIKKAPIEDIRLRGRTAIVVVKSQYESLEEVKREAVLSSVFFRIRKKFSNVNKVLVFSADKKFLFASDI